MKVRTDLIVAAALCCMSGNTLRAGQPPQRADTADLLGIGGVRPLTVETYEQAKSSSLTVNQDRNEPLPIGRANSPFLIAVQHVPPGLSPRDTLARIRDIAATMEEAPFTFFVSTPYSRISAIAAEAKRKYSSPNFPPMEDVNKELAMIVVSGSTSLLKLDTIENVVIKRGDKVLQPLKSVVIPTEVQNPMGATKPSADGTFSFDFAAFTPDATITLVLIGKRGNFEWPMSPAELMRLR